ncbi:MAG: DNA replication and repair protein RecF [Paramuribaculum sp.]|nr:DNA replication and repair protein RecF [Paramuribaculum sp.]
MQLRSLTVSNFKNISGATLDFSPKINCFLGDNGMGKSNLLDAIHFLSFCRSFTGVPDSLVVKNTEDFMIAKGIYRRRDTDEELLMAIQKGKRKSLKRGGKEYSRLSEHIGLFPVVLASPADTELAKGPSEERRRWMDMVISQENRPYLEALIRYSNSLRQRNRLLRDGISDPSLYGAIEMQMAMAEKIITPARKIWTLRLTERVGHYYREIAGDVSEAPVIGYRAGYTGESFERALGENRRRDEFMRHTTVGPHRDDIEMELNGMPLRRTASQGQTKTFTTALRLAQYDFLRESCGIKPLLLLDDIFDKLDSNRVEKIMKLVTSPDFGQIFITDTNRKHLDDIIGLTEGDRRLWAVTNGNFSLIDSAAS